ncbi:MAG: hypothetical protein LBF25_00490, partial [Puniceicoccales bacterium]|nr:hypothetical protein [Puniceicoccales bacterium]
TKPAAPLAKNAAVVLSPDDPFLLLRLTPLTFLFGAPICDPGVVLCETLGLGSLLSFGVEGMFRTQLLWETRCRAA